MARNAAPNMERWFFYQDVAELWKWARLDLFGSVLDHSGAAFDSRDKCLDDARRRGYREDCRAETPLPSMNTERGERAITRFSL